MNRRSWTWVLRWVITIASIFLLLQNMEFRKLPSLLFSADPRNLTAALILALAQFGIGAWRWQKLTVLMSGKIIKWKPLFYNYLISFFLSCSLPGAITGDALRIYNTREILNGSSMAAAIVLMEKILGLAVLILFAAIFIFLVPENPFPPIHCPNGVIIALVALVIGGVFLGFYYGRGKIPPLSRWLHQFTGPISHLPLTALRNPKLAVQTLAGTFLFQLFSLLVVFECLASTRNDISLSLFLCIAPVVTVFLLLPVSVQGIGVREYLYLLFLGGPGRPPDPILAGLTLTYIIGFPFALWGWLLFYLQPKELKGFHEPA